MGATEEAIKLIDQGVHVNTTDGVYLSRMLNVYSVNDDVSDHILALKYAIERREEGWGSGCDAG